MNVSFDRMKCSAHEQEKQYILNKIEFLMSAKRNKTSLLKVCIKRSQKSLQLDKSRIRVLKS